MPEKNNDFPWTTAPLDPRYPNANVTRYCFQMFVDYQRCTRLLSKGHAPCDYFKKVYTTMCPYEWVARWSEQVEKGTFPLDLPKPSK